MRVAIIAPPWIALPIKGYGGIELVLESLISGLTSIGVEVEVFGNTERTLPGIKMHSVYDKEQFSNIHKPIYESLPIVAAHMQYSLSKIKEDGGFDIIHDHVECFGPELLNWATVDKDLPPAIHTMHGPPFSNDVSISKGWPDNRPFWTQLGNHMNRVYIVGISDSLIKHAPKELKKHILPTVYNSIIIDKFPFVKKKKDYFMTLGRFTCDKGQHIAARICAKNNLELKMAGIIENIATKDQLDREINNPLSSLSTFEGFKYYKEQVLPYTLNSKVSYVGSIQGDEKNKMISEAKALLFSIDWEEPFGMAVIEALACGTPVVAMNRGAMSEIIEHGVTGFLANNEEEFENYIDRIDDIDPVACRKSVEDKFSSHAMALAYLDRYNQAIKLNGSDVI